MLDRGKRLRGKLLYIGLIAVLRVFFEELHGILVRIDLLTGVCFVEILSGRTIEIIDKLLMLGIELCGNVYFDIFGFYDAHQLIGGFCVSIHHLLTKLLHRIRLSDVGGVYCCS